MGNIYDYIEWRGDLSFESAPFNEVDNLILSWLSYVDMAGIVPEGYGRVTVDEVATQYFQTHERIGKVDYGMFINPTQMVGQLLDKLQGTVRFGGIGLTNYVCRLNQEENEQFAAVTALITDDLAYISYRGTDNTIIGWKEDFYMSFMCPIPSQRDALKYLESMTGIGDRELIVGGHSKGGNLAVYAAALAGERVRERIRIVYNNDGPGFSDEFIRSGEFTHLSGHVKTIIPHSSVIGMLFEHIEQHDVIKAKQIGLLQHVVLNWEVMGASFIRVPEGVSVSSALLDRTAKAWLSSLSAEQLKELVDTLFSALEQTGAATFDELSKGGFESAWVIIRSLIGLEPKSRELIGDILKKLAEAGAANTHAMLRERWVRRFRAVENHTRVE